jgi:predicted porin
MIQKSLLTLLLTAGAAGAVCAQVRITGNIDAGIARTNDQWQVRSGGPGRNNVTFSGTEDLGDGARAFFLLNHRFNPDDGTPSYGANNAASQPYWRQLWVGLGGRWGDVRLGRMLVPHQQFNGAYEPWETYTVATLNTGGNPVNIRANDTVYYRTPKFAGLQVHLSTSDPTAQGHPASTNTRQLGAGLQYEQGPASFALAWDRDAGNRKTQAAYGKYSFGPAKAMFQYEQIDLNLTGWESKRWSVGATAVVGGLTTLKVGYREQNDDVASGTRKQKKYAAGLDYSLSKRTFLYTNVAKQSGQGFTTLQRKAMFDVGISHAF